MNDSTILLPFGRWSKYKSTVKVPLVVSMTTDILLQKKSSNKIITFHKLQNHQKRPLPILKTFVPVCLSRLPTWLTWLCWAVLDLSICFCCDSSLTQSSSWTESWKGTDFYTTNLPWQWSLFLICQNTMHCRTTFWRKSVNLNDCCCWANCLHCKF